MKKIKYKIKSWLGIHDHHVDIHALKIKISSLEKRLALYEETVQIGVDYHPSEHQSWAVVCIAGNREYVNFINLDRKDAEYIQRMFRDISSKNKCYDGPYGAMMRFEH